MNTIDTDIIDAIKRMVADQVSRARNRDPEWEHALRSLVADIERHREDAQRLYDDMKATGLTAGTIEAEGYLRAMNLATEDASYRLKLPEEPDDDE